MKIIVAGPGCGRCHATEKNVQEACKELSLDADISHEFDVKRFRWFLIHAHLYTFCDFFAVCCGCVKCFPGCGSIVECLTGDVNTDSGYILGVLWV